MMDTISELFQQYRQRTEAILREQHSDHNACLIALENRMADGSGLPEHDRMELRARMQEYRRQKLDGYEAGARNPRISRPGSGPDDRTSSRQ